MDTNRLMVELVTPEGRLLYTEAAQVEYPSSAGELGILPGHVPLLTDLETGELRIFSPGQVRRFAVAGGYVQVFPQSVRVVATFASSGEDETAIEQACQRAKEALETATNVNPAVLEAELRALRHEFVRLRQTQKRGRH